MGLSGMKGKVCYVDHACPIIDPVTSVWTTPAGSEEAWSDEVTKFEVVDSAQKREYGHDKSHGWQDVVTGIRRLAITLNAVMRAGTGVSMPIHAGGVLFLVLYPTGTSGTCTTPIKGYAAVDQVSYTYDQEKGDPIAYTATLSSKGPWYGLADDPLNAEQRGGFECDCDGI